MSGLQASISTHIARAYLYPDGHWGANEELYWRAVGDHPDRLHNMYFSFLFLLRAVVRAQPALLAYPYDTGHPGEDRAVRELLGTLLAHATPTTRSGGSGGGSGGGEGLSAAHIYGSMSGAGGSSGSSGTGRSAEETVAAVEECRYGFDESELFQVSSCIEWHDYCQLLDTHAIPSIRYYTTTQYYCVSPHACDTCTTHITLATQVSEALQGPQYWSSLEEKHELRDEFMTK